MAARSPLIAVAAAGLLLPEGFSRCCPQAGYRIVAWVVVAFGASR